MQVGKEKVRIERSPITKDGGVDPIIFEEATDFTAQPLAAKIDLHRRQNPNRAAMRGISKELPPGRIRHDFPQTRPSYRMETSPGIVREKSTCESRRMHIAGDIAGTEKDRLWGICHEEDEPARISVTP
jgi:hypothetical protein